jgi:hypothetical protein
MIKHHRTAEGVNQSPVSVPAQDVRRNSRIRHAALLHVAQRTGQRQRIVCFVPAQEQSQIMLGQRSIERTNLVPRPSQFTVY